MQATDSLTTTLLDEPGEETREALRSVLLGAHSTFALYRALMLQAGVSLDDLRSRDPLEMLRRLPPLTGQRFTKLADESIVAGNHIIDMETSSGTTGPRKRRVITHRDEATETTFLAELFGVCGICGSDRVACVDTGPLTLMVSFAKALDRLGVEEAYAFCVSTDVQATVENLVRLDPSVIVTIPSILDRYLGAVKQRLDGGVRLSLQKVVFVGEPLSRQTRSVLEEEMGAEVFSYYGASETSALGIECQAHAGIHLFTDRNIIELAPTTAGSPEGEVLVTTLRQEGLPLLRYALRDVVGFRNGPCPCGLRYPRVDVKGRSDGTASVLGAKITYRSIYEAAYRGVDAPGPLEVILSKDPRETVTLVMPDSLAATEPKIRRGVLRMEPDLAYLTGGEFLALELAFVGESYFGTQRKARRIVDRRGSDDAPV